MNRTSFTAALSTTMVLAVLAASASATVIGTATQGSSQGVNAQQLANATTATGNIVVLNPTASTPSEQDNVNTLTSTQSVGTAGGADTFISPTGAGPSQGNQQGANSQQASANGAIGVQNGRNELGNSQIVGGDQTCVPPVLTPCTASTIIASPSQGNHQGVNASQIADGGVTTGDIIVATGFTFNAPAGPVFQTGVNPVTNSQIVLG